MSLKNLGAKEVEDAAMMANKANLPIGAKQTETLPEHEYMGKNFQTYSVGMKKLLNHPNIMKTFRGTPTPNDVHVKDDEQLIKKAFMDMYPQIKADFYVFIECRTLRDPDTIHLRRHIGSHPELLKSCADADGFAEIIENMKSNLEYNIGGTGKSVALVFVCNKGTHRSESCRLLTNRVWKIQNIDVAKTQALTCRPCVADRGSSSCARCDPNTWNHADKKMISEACDKMHKMLFYEEAKTEAADVETIPNVHTNCRRYTSLQMRIDAMIQYASKRKQDRESVPSPKRRKLATPTTKQCETPHCVRRVNLKPDYKGRVHRHCCSHCVGSHGKSHSNDCLKRVKHLT